MPRPASWPRASLACALALSACAPVSRGPQAPPPPAHEATPSAPRPDDDATSPSPPEPLPEPAPELALSALPPRPAGAPSGQAFLRAIEAEGEQAREDTVVRELCRGNVPGSLRRLARLETRGETSSGRSVALTFWVTPDYLAIGDDADSVRVPMNAVSAQIVADRLGFVLPTAKVVDLVYHFAKARLSPRTFPPDAAMMRVGAFARHDELIDEQLGRREPLGLVAGHKKDVVVSNRLQNRPHRLAIYGWHRAEGQPIQPLSTVHGDWYSDYSHGVRLLGATVLVDGEPRRTADVLADPELAPLLSDEGPIEIARYRTDEGPGRLAWWPTAPAPKHAAPVRQRPAPRSARRDRKPNLARCSRGSCRAPERRFRGSCRAR